MIGPLRDWPLRDDLLERGEHRDVRALAVHGAAAVEHAVLDSAPQGSCDQSSGTAWTVS